MEHTDDSQAGAALYTPFVLRFYDPVVHGFNLPVLWRCRSARVQRLYVEFASATPLDIGVGAGFASRRGASC